MCGGRRSMIHQLRSKTASEIFSLPSIYYTVDYNRESIAEFQAKLKFPGTNGYSKYAPVLFPDGRRDMKKLFRCVELTKVMSRSKYQIFMRSANFSNRSKLDFKVDLIWPDVPVIQEAALAHYSRESLGGHFCNARCNSVNCYSCEL
jgi:hypothetical protein